ncbi:hypothetical protein E8L90_00020 [Brevibacillus antibioticus]|uniref:Uncharacterized protein n=1 Tax=Brevibacillus antibioticus TaxID=2570228 RepID=A0A4U2Y0U0_9BACL|nr:hypothetical protein E8L90_00020 [Brevibacillus antibioticus]
MSTSSSTDENYETSDKGFVHSFRIKDMPLMRASNNRGFFSVKNVSTFFIKVDATACGQQNGHDRFVWKKMLT